MVKVKVLEVDIRRRRIALSMRLGDSSREHISTLRKTEPAGGPRPAKSDSPKSGALADAFNRARRPR